MIWWLFNKLIWADTIYSVFQLTRWIGSEDWYILMGFFSIVFYSLLSYIGLGLVHKIVRAPADAANSWKMTRWLAKGLSIFPRATALARYLALLGVAYGAIGIGTNCYFESFPGGSRELKERNFVLNHFVPPRENENSKGEWRMVEHQKTRMPQDKIEEMEEVIEYFKTNLDLFEKSKFTPEALNAILEIYMPFARVVPDGTGVPTDKVVREEGRKILPRAVHESDDPVRKNPPAENRKQREKQTTSLEIEKRGEKKNQKTVVNIQKDNSLLYTAGILAVGIAIWYFWPQETITETEDYNSFDEEIIDDLEEKMEDKPVSVDQLSLQLFSQMVVCSFCIVGVVRIFC